LAPRAPRLDGRAAGAFASRNDVGVLRELDAGGASRPRHQVAERRL
jgi:hypothetical protein